MTAHSVLGHDRLENYCKTWKLEVNLKKSKVMCFSKSGKGGMKLFPGYCGHLQLSRFCGFIIQEMPSMAQRTTLSFRLFSPAHGVVKPGNNGNALVPILTHVLQQELYGETPPLYGGSGTDAMICLYSHNWSVKK